MALLRTTLVILLVFVVFSTTNAQNIGFRFALNTAMFVNELGDSDVPHPNALLATPAISTEKFVLQPTLGFEGEILFELSPSSYFGVEVDYSRLKGYNDTPPVYNWYLTPYNPIDTFTISPVAFNTSLINVAVNWKYFFFQTSPFRPFVKLTGVVAFVGTDFTFKNDEDATDFDTNILYARGTSNSEKGKWPAFHVGGGIGFEYKIHDKLSFQVDGTATVLNSDIVNGVPNFTYAVEDDNEILKYNKRLSLTVQASAGIVYYIETSRPSGTRGAAGKIDPNLPFYRKKK